MSNVITGQLKAKARTNKAFKLDDNKWYEVSGKTEEFLANMNKPYPQVEVTYEQNGYKRKVTFIKPVGAGEAPAQNTTVVNNTVVDTGSKSKPSYDYKKSAKKQEDKPTQEYWDKRGLDIKKGNALNASAYALSGTEPDVEALAEKVLFLANKFYEYLTLED